jgi:hypothetical protein
MAEDDGCVYVKTIDGESIQIRLINNMSVKQIKNRIKAVTGVAVAQQSLIFGGREIKDGDLLTDTAITKGSTV